MGKLWSYIEHTLSIVNTSETFPNVAFVAVVVGFFVLRNALLPTRSFLFLVCNSECGKEVRTALAGQSLWGFCLSVISCVTQTTETRSNKNFTVQQTRMWPMYATWCVLFVTGHTWKLPRGFLPSSPIVESNISSCLKFRVVFWEKNEAFLLGEVTNVVLEYNWILQRCSAYLHLWFSSFSSGFGPLMFVAALIHMK